MSSNASPADFLLSRSSIVVVCPMTFAAAYLAAHPIQCPSCGSNRISMHGWSESFRPVVDLDCNMLIKARRYMHRDCSSAAARGRKHTSFSALNSHLIAALPPVVRERLYPFQIRQKTVISTAFARQVHESKVSGASFAQIASLQKATLWLRSPGLFTNSNPIVAFPSFGHCLRFPLVGPGLVRDIYCGEMRRLEALQQAAIAATTAEHLCGDHTFFVAKHGRDADGKQGFTAVFTMMNQLSEVVGFWVTRSKSLKEIEKEIEMLKARLGDIKGIWIDNPDSDEAFLLDKFPEAAVRRDLFHVLQEYFRECSSMPLRSLFMANVANAFFSLDQDDVDALTAKLRDKGVDVDKLTPAFFRSHRSVRTYVPDDARAAIAERLEAAVQQYRGKDLFKSGFEKLHLAILKQLEQGKLTDPPNETMHANINPDGDPHYVTFRSSSQLESLHKFLQACFHGFNGSYELLHILLLDRISRWNMHKSRHLAKREVFVCSVDLALVTNIISLSTELGLAVPACFSGYTTIEPHWPSGETPSLEKELFGLARPLRTSETGLAVEAHIRKMGANVTPSSIKDLLETPGFVARAAKIKMSASAKWLARRMSLHELPTFVADGIEDELFKAMLPGFYPKTDKSMEHKIEHAKTSKMAMEWNSLLLYAISAGQNYVRYNEKIYFIDTIRYKDAKHIKAACKAFLAAIEVAAAHGGTREGLDEMRETRKGFSSAPSAHWLNTRRLRGFVMWLPSSS
ncbi:hypothetical protein SDRG_16917 [Saprolegnia diclina VS20]|uniref:Uncharacterized protein n=1 Tax=Saprolegnia diclina (strain VS20) TaxID=1156394 RepID=T0PW16_SAPDV|nr:hypothetical protein SDRG_16917 [Saprolegnia diclina VS20]EQC25220.1 hypothetical protein SDRG_16917 [Saprolegnia diclina VS20]|eukprot:XP_008621364.1 hypothetical protein SDRG_16917 [Saprolegnia diclina VS20]